MGDQSPFAGIGKLYFCRVEDVEKDPKEEYFALDKPVSLLEPGMLTYKDGATTFNGMLELWCSIYRPILHNVDNRCKRFYEMEPKQRIGRFVKKIDNSCTPCVAVQDNTASRSPNHTVYFLSRIMEDFFKKKEYAETYAKMHMEQSFRDFMAWMLNKKKEGKDTDIMSVINTLKFDTVSFWTGKENGWMWVGARFRIDNKFVKSE